MRNKYLFLIVAALSLVQPTLADTTIDGGGSKLTLTETGTLMVPSFSTLTLKNLTLEGLKAERLIMENGTSKLKLDNAKIILDGDYTFSQGCMEVLNNSSIEGEYSFTFAGHYMMIWEKSELKVGNNTTFVCTPTSGSNLAMKFENDTSTFFLDGATLKNYVRTFYNDPVGLVFSKGNFKVDGTSILESAGTTTDTALILGTGTEAASDCSLKIRPHAKLIVKGSGLVYRNNGANGFNTSGNLGTVELRDGGEFVIENSSTALASTGVNVRSPMQLIGQNALDLDKNNMVLDMVELSGFTGEGQVSSISGSNRQGSSLSLTGSAGGSFIPSAPFDMSPDGAFVAFGIHGSHVASTQRVFIYRYSPAASTPFTEITPGISLTDNALSVAFSPDRKYLAVGTDLYSGSAQLRIYKIDPFAATPFDATGLTPVNFGNQSVEGMAWSPDGRYLICTSTTQQGFAGVTIHVYKFDPSSPTTLTEIGSGITLGSLVFGNCYAFSPDGKYVFVGLTDLFVTAAETELRAFSFDPTSATPLTLIQGINYTSGQLVDCVTMSPDGRYLAVGLSTDSGSAYEIRIYRFDPKALTPLVEVTPGVSTTGAITHLSFSADGLHLVASLDTSDPSQVRVYRFDPGASTPLTEAGSGVDFSASPLFYATTVESIGAFFTPNGRYVVSGGADSEATGGGTASRITSFRPPRTARSPELDVNDGTLTLKQDIKIKDVTIKAT